MIRCGVPAPAYYILNSFLIIVYTSQTFFLRGCYSVQTDLLAWYELCTECIKIKIIKCIDIIYVFYLIHPFRAFLYQRIVQTNDSSSK